MSLTAAVDLKSSFSAFRTCVVMGIIGTVSLYAFGHFNRLQCRVFARNETLMSHSQCDFIDTKI